MRTTVTTRAEVPALVVNPQKNGRYFRAQVAFRDLAEQTTRVALWKRNDRQKRNAIQFEFQDC